MKMNYERYSFTSLGYPPIFEWQNNFIVHNIKKLNTSWCKKLYMTKK